MPTTVKCYNELPPFKAGEAYDAEAIPGRRWRVHHDYAEDPEYHYIEVSEQKFKRHFTIIRQQSPSGKHSYGNFTVESSAQVRRLLGYS
jgi:hypothetical protein